MEQRLRLHLLLIVTLSGAVAFLFSVAVLRLGITSMAWRYPLAVACGYVTFLLLIRAWIALHTPARRSKANRSGHLVDAIDLLDVGVPTRASAPANTALFGGGRSGGGGAGTSWGNSGSRASAGSAFDVDVDVDDLWPVILALVCLLGGLIVIAYVIYSAPVMLGEVAVDAAIVSGLYKQLKKREPSHWAMTVVRHTAVPAAALVVFAMLAGFAAERIAPEARSIGGVIRSLAQ